MPRGRSQIPGPAVAAGAFVAAVGRGMMPRPLAPRDGSDYEPSNTSSDDSLGYTSEPSVTGSDYGSDYSSDYTSDTGSGYTSADTNEMSRDSLDEMSRSGYTSADTNDMSRDSLDEMSRSGYTSADTNDMSRDSLDEMSRSGYTSADTNDMSRDSLDETDSLASPYALNSPAPLAVGKQVKVQTEALPAFLPLLCTEVQLAQPEIKRLYANQASEPQTAVQMAGKVSDSNGGRISNGRTSKTSWIDIYQDRITEKISTNISNFVNMVENWEKIKTYHCKGCQQNVNILLWRKTHNSLVV